MTEQMIQKEQAIRYLMDKNNISYAVAKVYVEQVLGL